MSKDNSVISSIFGWLIRNVISIAYLKGQHSIVYSDIHYK